jgi:hypothetical protein
MNTEILATSYELGGWANGRRNKNISRTVVDKDNNYDHSPIAGSKDIEWDKYEQETVENICKRIALLTRAIEGSMGANGESVVRLTGWLRKEIEMVYWLSDKTRYEIGSVVGPKMRMDRK